MRKALLAVAVAGLAVCGVAYAAGATTTYYVDKSTKITPVKSGTKKHPVAIGLHLGYGEMATPSTDRPTIVKKFKISAPGLTENTNDFKACGTSRVTQQGASSCPKGSNIGTGYFIAAASSTTNTTTILTCRAELTVFNGGNHTLTLYVYKGAPVAGQPGPCPLPPSGYAIAAKLSQKGGVLSQTFSVPPALRHVTVGGTTFDVALEQAFATIPVKKTTIVKHVHGKKVKEKVGIFASDSCPANHKRQVAVTFTPESGSAQTATRNIACK